LEPDRELHKDGVHRRNKARQGKDGVQGNEDVQEAGIPRQEGAAGCQMDGKHEDRSLQQIGTL
jgi:hypothetical protein